MLAGGADEDAGVEVGEWSAARDMLAVGCYWRMKEVCRWCEWDGRSRGSVRCRSPRAQAMRRDGKRQITGEGSVHNDQRLLIRCEARRRTRCTRRRGGRKREREAAEQRRVRVTDVLLPWLLLLAPSTLLLCGAMQQRQVPYRRGTQSDAVAKR